MNWIKKAAATIPGVGSAVAAIEVVDMIGGGGANGGGGSDKSIKFLESSVNSRIDSIKDQINLKDCLNETKNVLNVFQTEVNRTTAKIEKEITSNFQSVSQATSQLRQDAFTQIGNVHSNLSESLKQTASKFQQDLSLETEKLERSCTQKIDMESKKLGDSINKIKNDAIEEISKNEQEINGKIHDIQKSFTEGIKEILAINEQNKAEAHQLLKSSIEEVSQKRKELEALMKSEIGKAESFAKEYKNETDLFHRESDKKIQKIIDEAKEAQSLHNELRNKVYSVVDDIEQIRDSLSKNTEQFQDTKELCQTMIEECKETITKLFEKELQNYQQEMSLKMQQTEQATENANNKINANTNNILKAVTSLEKIETREKDLKQISQQVQNKMREDANIRKLSDNQMQNRVSELEKKLDAMNDKYLNLLKDNINIRKKLDDLVLQQMETPKLLAKNYSRQYKRESEDEYSDGEEFTNDFKGTNS